MNQKQPEYVLAVQSPAHNQISAVLFHIESREPRGYFQVFVTHYDKTERENVADLIKWVESFPELDFVVICKTRRDYQVINQSLKSHSDKTLETLKGNKLGVSVVFEILGNRRSDISITKNTCTAEEKMLAGDLRYYEEFVSSPYMQLHAVNVLYDCAWKACYLLKTFPSVRTFVFEKSTGSALSVLPITPPVIKQEKQPGRPVGPVYENPTEEAMARVEAAMRPPGDPFALLGNSAAVGVVGLLRYDNILPIGEEEAETKSWWDWFWNK